MINEAPGMLLSDEAEKACEYLTSVLGGNPLLLTELDLSGKISGDSGLKKLCALLKDSHCRVKTLKLSDCGVTGELYAALTKALKSNPSHLEELDLRGNDPGDSGVELLTDLLQDPTCKLQRLRQDLFTLYQ
ncbi:NACHT, LRR and PYD domains-containing protein 12-like [Engraulis encrasicolus]|uniref:NACHT, LRR and PYD domains-containing protein 12-like n=1 Tax=Engraulis encrasicolus TaxID=184585 RepID=UPI002FD67582